MFKKFNKHILRLLTKKSNVLVGVSGGLDSMVLCSLLIESKIKFSVAHVNYNLRKPESDNDELFLKNYCFKNNLTFYAKRYDLSNQKNSIQEVARNLRYKFFNNIYDKQNHTHILTAHHHDDNIETLLINIYRGKKINVFSGIEESKKNLVRPFLIFNKDELLKYALKNKLKWRHDISNSSNKYLRNKIRNILIPKLKLIDSNYRNNFKTLIKNSKNKKIFEDIYLNKIEKLYLKKNGDNVIESKKANWIGYNTKSIELMLFRKYGFFKNSEILKILNARTGKIIYSKTHQILSNRDSILIKKIDITLKKNYFLEFNKKENPISILVKKSKKCKKPSLSEIYINNSVKMPLIIRKTEKGDFFYPYGMKGKKKVSKFFKDEKLSIFDKQNQWILTDSKNQILWIVGLRADKRFIKNNGECLKISL